MNWTLRGLIHFQYDLIPSKLMRVLNVSLRVFWKKKKGVGRVEVISRDTSTEANRRVDMISLGVRFQMLYFWFGRAQVVNCAPIH
jgi:hypothetical protein